jgi:hypothetical protein
LAVSRALSPRLCGWAAGVVAFTVMAGVCLREYYPPLPSPLQLEISFNRTAPGSFEPVLVSGRPGSADWLEIRRVDQTTVIFGYESWGAKPVYSGPVAIEPDARRALQIDMPGLTQVRGQFQRESRRLSVVYDGVTVLDTDVAYHARAGAALYFGQNPNGGAGLGPELSGRIYRTGGGELRGGVTAFLTPVDRVFGWLATSRLQVTSLVILAAAIGAMAGRLRRLTVERVVTFGVAARAALVRHRWFAGFAAICTIGFAYVVTWGSGQLLYPEIFGNFYDFQAGSLLQGRWDVPEDALGAEAFVFEGRFYGYFGPTPALLRIPFLIFQVGVGRLSRAFMLADYVACLVAAYLILRFLYSSARGDGADPAPWAVALVTLNVGLGSTIFFVSSRAFTYHEAILCGTAFALWCTYCTLRYAAHPKGRWWVGALLCGTLAVHARPPVGLFALSILGFSALALLLRGRLRPRAAARAPEVVPRPGGGRKHLVVGLLCVGAALSFNAVSYLKFKSFEGAPLKYHVQYESAHLDRIEGRNFHVSNLAYNVEAYLVQPLWQFRPTFPYVLAQGHLGVGHPNARIIVAEPMLGLPFSMPGLFWPAIAGVLGAFVRYPALRRPLLTLGAAAVPVSMAMFTAVATSQRYTADFCPLLICGAAYAVLAVEGLRPAWRRAALAAWSVLAAAAILVTLALTLRYQGELVWGVPERVSQDYRALGARIDHVFNVTARGPQ